MKLQGACREKKSFRAKAMEPPQNISDIRDTLEGLESFCHSNQMWLTQKHRDQGAVPALETAYVFEDRAPFSGQ